MGHGGAQGGSAAAAPPVEKFRKDYAALPYSIDSVDLDFNVQTDETLVTSTLKLTPTGGGPLVLDGEACVRLRRSARPCRGMTGA